MNHIEDVTKKILYKNVQQAKELCKRNGIIFRIKRQDKTRFFFDVDYKHNRCTVEIDNDIITNYEIG